MPGLFTRGVVLEQNKEPALSRDLLEFMNNNTVSYFEGPKLVQGQEPDAAWILNAARQAEIVDEGDGVPLADKLTKKGVDCVVADAIDDEPYVSSQINLLLKRESGVAEGLRLAARALGCSQLHIAVYKNISDVVTKIPKKVDDIPVDRIRGRYPAEFRAKENFSQYKNVLFIGASALLHLYRAVYENRRQTTCFVTVAGNCVGNPNNLEVSIGMPLSQLLERCGLYREPNKIIIGGPMTGVCVIDPENTQVTVKTRAVLAMYEDVKNKYYQCIGCGKCVDVCPENLSPYYFYKNTERGLYPRLAFYEIDRCIECGTCSYVCPSKIELLDYIRLGKQKARQERLYEQERERARRLERERSDEFESRLARRRRQELLESFSKAKNASLELVKHRKKNAAAPNGTSAEKDTKQSKKAKK